MAASAICKIKHEVRGRDAYKAQGEAECFIGHQGSTPSALFCIQQELVHALTVLKDLPINAIKNSPSSRYALSSPSPCQVRQHWTISYANASVRRLISAKLTWICHFYFLLIIRFSHLTVQLYWQYSTPDAFPVLYG